MKATTLPGITEALPSRRSNANTASAPGSLFEDSQLNADAQLTEDRFDEVARFPRGGSAEQLCQHLLLCQSIGRTRHAVEILRHLEQRHVALTRRQEHLECVSEVAHLAALEGDHSEWRA